MGFAGRKGVLVMVLLIVTAVSAIVFGVVTGLALAGIRNTEHLDTVQRGETFNALPTIILDRTGREITQFFGDERRELVPIDELPRHLINALITREDRTFFHHHGFSFRGTARAAWNLLRGRYVSGGSTITQQLAGHLYADRTEFSLVRKLRELWWALQLEKRLTKYEILEEYLNKMPFGHGNYGVESASQFYFGRSARDLTHAESAILVIQLANPSLYSPIRRPNQARVMQRVVLNDMVTMGFATQEEVDFSFDDYWNNYDFTRSNVSTAFFDREDRARYFSEFVRFQLENEYLFGRANVNRDGFTVHTTLDLDYQRAADRHMAASLETSNRIYEQNRSVSISAGDKLIPAIELSALLFDIPELRVGDAKERSRTLEHYQRQINPVIDMVSLLFGSSENDELRHVARVSYTRTEREAQRTRVEGGLVTLDNSTGHILALIGGSGFEARNQLNRAVDARVLPGSAFKPMYYAAGIDKQVVTSATTFYDAPVVFWNDDGTPYTPNNYFGRWWGWVDLTTSLAASYNIPSLRVLDRVGFTDAFRVASRLMGIPESSLASRGFVRNFPVGLGTVSVSPMEMARGYATIANLGREVVPIAVRYIEDRDGRVILEPEQEIRLAQQRRGRETQVISPQAAYVMTEMMKATFEIGTMAGARARGGGFDDMPMAGKTGSTQNWSDAWSVGYSPYVTTAVWFGFDRGGNNSLGTNQTGAAAVAPMWVQYMREIHEERDRVAFPKPNDGLTTVRVSARTGLLPPENYTGRTVERVFISGTEPTQFDTLQEFERDWTPVFADRMRDAIAGTNLTVNAFGGPRPQSDLSVDLDFDIDLRFPGYGNDFDLNGDLPASGGNPLLD